MENIISTSPSIEFLSLVVWFSTHRMCSLLTILSVDPTLCRADYGSFSDQALVEMLYEGFDTDTKIRFRGDEGAYLDVCEWDIVVCDAGERVVQIMEYDFVTGSLQLCYLPPNVKRVKMTNGHFTGSIDLTNLPESIESVYLYGNGLTGAIDLTKLPEGMQELYLDDNAFRCSVDFAHLPQSMMELLLNINQFSGSVDLAHLPDGMCDLYLCANSFAGSVDLTRLPRRLKILRLDYN